MDDFKTLYEEFRTFRDKRDWKKFHTPKDLSLALFIEMGEIAENFLWKTPEEIDLLKSNNEKSSLVAEELSDVLFYLLSLADSLGVNLLQAAREKLEKNKKKYPLEHVKGKAHKYTYYQKEDHGF